jgi:hypothetical protein
LEWYDAPIYPALALLIGIGFSTLYEDLLKLYQPRFNRYGGWMVKAALFVTVFYSGYYTVVRRIIDERHSDYGAGPDGHLGRYVTKLAHEQPQINDIAVASSGSHYAVLQYYRAEFEQVPGRHFAVVSGKEVHKMPAGKVVVLCDPAYRASLDSAFQVVEMHQNAQCQTLLLLPRQR